MVSRTSVQGQRRHRIHDDHVNEVTQRGVERAVSGDEHDVGEVIIVDARSLRLEHGTGSREVDSAHDDGDVILLCHLLEHATHRSTVAGPRGIVAGDEDAVGARREVGMRCVSCTSGKWNVELLRSSPCAV